MVLLTSSLYNITDVLQKVNDIFLMLAFLIGDNLTVVIMMMLEIPIQMKEKFSLDRCKIQMLQDL